MLALMFTLKTPLKTELLLLWHRIHLGKIIRAIIAFNAVLIFILILFGGESEPSAEGVFAYAIYFVCHFAIAAILVIHSLQKWTLSTNSLFILLFIASCLPLWMLFV